MKFATFLITLLFYQQLAAQEVGSVLIMGTVQDERGRLLQDATVQLIPLADAIRAETQASDRAGNFRIQAMSPGLYQIRISYVGWRTLVIDSISVKAAQAEIQLGELILKSAQSNSLQEVVVHAERPLIQSKDGNLTFNVAESPLAAGSNASELLGNTPLVTKDADGKISVRGKEPKILIDDKPVELNLQQLQDLLESLPGSAIEKIEVMTNPPPQYANEQGGVINIVTKKGVVGKTGRVSLSGGTRGEASSYGNFTYRRQGFAISINAGASYHRFNGGGNSTRRNFFTDSSNFFYSTNEYVNKAVRPNFRFNLDYDLDKFQSLNLVLQANANDYINRSGNEYRNVNRLGETYRLSERAIMNDGESLNGSIAVSYLLKTRRVGEQLRVFLNTSRSSNNSDRDFFQQYFTPDHLPNGIDSTQQQLTANRGNGYNLRINYDRPLIGQKTFLSTGGYFNRSNSNIDVDASYLRKADDSWLPSALLSNDFRFHQTVMNWRTSLRQLISTRFSVSAGLAVEQTSIWFELLKEGREARNTYRTWLPFASLNKSWEGMLNVSLSYRRSIRRPGINELNPTIDYSDPYNTRFGNPQLEASTADNFDLVIGRNRPTHYINIGLGYNRVRDIFSPVRTLVADGKTEITWENISGRREYEGSLWGGLNLSKRWKLNVSGSYTFNRYSSFDRTVNRYRNGGSFTSHANGVFSPNDRWNFTGSFTINRFANPQGYARWNWSMNAGIQHKLLSKRMTITLNVIDPIVEQRNRYYTYGSNFELQGYNETHTRNFRMTIGYNLTRPAKKNMLLEKVKQG